MKVKVFEVRDKLTFIPVMAIQMKSEDLVKRYYLRRVGFGEDSPLIEVVRMDNDKCSYDPYKWGQSTRTMREAHKYIAKNWGSLNNGDVIDIEYILGETTSPKVTERFDEWSNRYE